MTVILAISLLIYITRRLLTRACVVRQFLPQIRRLGNSRSTSDIYCEISNGVDTSLLYVCSLHIHALHVQLRPENGHYPKLLSYDNHFFTDTVNIDWQSSSLDLITLHESITLPTALLVPFLSTRKTRAIISQAHTIRLLIVSDGIIYTSLGPKPDTCYSHWLGSQRAFSTRPTDTDLQITDLPINNPPLPLTTETHTAEANFDD